VSHDEKPEIILYLDTPPGKKELSNLLQKLHMKPIQLVRKNETIWKEEFKHRDLNASQTIAAMIKYPKLIERPIVVKGEKAVIGRPPELALTIL
jgi:arsenate reductase